MSDTSPGPVCPECGRPLDHPVLSVGFGPTEPEPVGSDRASRVGVALVIVVLLGVAAAAFLLPGDDDDPESTPTTTEAAPAPPAPAPSALARDLTLVGGTRAAYAAAEGVVIVEVESGRYDVTAVELARPVVAYDEPFVLVADDRRTLAVHPAAPEEPFVLATNYRLVATSVADQYVFVPADSGLDGADRVFVGQAQDGSFGPPIPIPPGSRRTAVAGVGVLVAAPDGATYRVGFAGLEPFSEATVLAATSTHRLEVVCEQGLRCEARVVAEDAPPVVLPEEAAAALVDPAVSPDGQWVAGVAGERIVRVAVATGAVDEFPVDAPVLALAWTPESGSLVALTGGPDRHRLVVLPSDDTDPGIVDLAARGAPQPLDSGLAVF